MGFANGNTPCCHIERSYSNPPGKGIASSTNKLIFSSLHVASLDHFDIITMNGTLIGNGNEEGVTGQPWQISQDINLKGFWGPVIHFIISPFIIKPLKKVITRAEARQNTSNSYQMSFKIYENSGHLCCTGRHTFSLYTYFTSFRAHSFLF